MLLSVLSAIAAGVLLTVRRALFLVTVQGHSMEPQYFPGDRVLAVRTGRRSPRTGDVVIVRRPACTSADARRERLFLKNVAAGPGDPVADLFTPATGMSAGETIPEGNFLVLGRHVASEDSKQWGFVPAADIQGRVIRPRKLDRANPRPGHDGPEIPDQ
ncbi:S26 family signal peptidase [Kitasatospora sp. NRRL B-11411]|uniref:S26 family signal peptidase n=1 Tax=Kitasatospora sp. NRRL B-11411 TaxID=1463822 RepID=UPI0012FF4611|nr:S26 family signal peptidase [Kitasatospora sp. NRRL B-11411]